MKKSDVVFNAVGCAFTLALILAMYYVAMMPNS